LTAEKAAFWSAGFTLLMPSPFFARDAHAEPGPLGRAFCLTDFSSPSSFPTASAHLRDKAHYNSAFLPRTASFTRAGRDEAAAKFPSDLCRQDGSQIVLLALATSSCQLSSICLAPGFAGNPFLQFRSTVSHWRGSLSPLSDTPLVAVQLSAMRTHREILGGPPGPTLHRPGSDRHPDSRK